MARKQGTSEPAIVRLEIAVKRPLRGVAYAMQRGKDVLLPPRRERDGTLRFELEMRLGAPQADGGARFLGEFTHGSVGDRFLYVNSGQRAGETNSCWDRRAKVKLASIPPALLERATRHPRARLRAMIEGTAQDGGPCCATVPLLDPGWELVEEKSGRKSKR